jgi:hypothetical protein
VGKRNMGSWVELQRTPPSPPLPPGGAGGVGELPAEAFRAAVADAVHQAVIAEAGTASSGTCQLYAFAGATALKALTGRDYTVQGGSLYLQPAPETDPTLAFVHDSRGGGLQRGAFHAWIVCPHGGPMRSGPVAPEQLEVVDLAARHYRSWAAMLGPWEHEEEVPYVWSWQASLPTWIQLVPDRATTNGLYASLREPGFQRVCRRLLRATLERVNTATRHTSDAG